MQSSLIDWWNISESTFEIKINSNHKRGQKKPEWVQDAVTDVRKCGVEIKWEKEEGLLNQETEKYTNFK